MSQQLGTKLMTTLIFPHIDYCCLDIYDDLTRELDTELQRFINCAIRLIFDVRQRERCRVSLRLSRSALNSSAAFGTLTDFGVFPHSTPQGETIGKRSTSLIWAIIFRDVNYNTL